MASRYSVDKNEVERFVEENPIVRNYLNKYSRGENRSSSHRQHAHILCRFFKWLRVVKRWDVSPKELLNDQLRRLSSSNISDMHVHVNLVLEHSRDNSDFEELSDGRKYQIYATIKSFYGYHEVILTRAKGKFGKRKKRKYYPKQISLVDLRRILGVLGQRERTIALIMFQSGLEIGAVLYKFSYMWDQIQPQLEARKEKIKIEIDERKGYGKWYFTYISRDAIHELKKWLVIRQRIVERAKEKSGYISPKIEQGAPIFITNKATPYGENNFHHNYDYIIRKRRLKRVPYAKVSHMFRKLFKTEASIPERAIDRNIVEFWMGHTGGIEKVGAEYDRTPEIYEKVIEAEYEKLEPFINIYSSPIAKRETDPLLRDLEKLAQIPSVREMFIEIVADIKTRLEQLARAADPSTKQARSVES